MARRTLIAGNWKMHKNREETVQFFTQLAAHTGLTSADPGCDIAIAAPYLLLESALETTRNLAIDILAQNFHDQPSGAFTGEVAIAMLTETGINGSVVGHSERRQFYGETDQSVAAKVKVAYEQSFRTVICIGETLEEREKNQTEKVLETQVGAILEVVPKNATELILAYEPVWAIGTGLTATPEQAQSAHAFIRGLVKKSHGLAMAGDCRILYGGSMKPANIGPLLSQEDIDGGLIGGASLKPEDFGAMIKAATSH